jgi:hypothetical protein
MKRTATRRWTAGLLLGFAAAGLASCADAGTGIDEQIPAGLVVLDASGNTVASASGSQVSGRVQVGVGQSRTYEVRLTSAGGTEIGLGSRYVLSPAVVITPLADATVSGSSRIVVTGKSAGTTSLTLRVLDGGNAVLSPLIPLTIS